MLATSETALSWARTQIANGDTFLAEEICAPAYSRVTKLEAGNQRFYLKQLPPQFWREAVITQKLAQLVPGTVSKIIAINEKLGCFISADGGIQLRQYINNGGDISAYTSILQRYAQLQQVAANEVQDFLTLGVPDWRLAQLPQLYRSMTESAEAKALKLTPEQQQKLLNYKNIFSQQCDELAIYAIPETIEHVDFQDKNIVVKNGTSRIIDWGEVVISHPFFSLKRCLVSAEWRHGYTQDHPSAIAMKFSYLGSWKDYASPESIERAYKLVEEMALPYAALAYAQLAAASGQGGAEIWNKSITPMLISISGRV